MKWQATLVSLLLACYVSSAQSFRLFAEDTRCEYPEVVINFLERYLHEIDSLYVLGEPVDIKINDDKFRFVKGYPDSVRQIDTTSSFCLDYYADNGYDARWFDVESGETILEVSFPASFELLLGAPKFDLEQCFDFELAKFDTLLFEPVDTSRLSMLNDSIFVTIPAESYYVESLTTATYHMRDSIGAYIPVFNKHNFEFSAANLLLGAIDKADEFMMYIEQGMYGFKKKSYTIVLSQWLEYCRSMGLICYFAVEETRVDGIKALLIAHSQELGFNHMMSLIIPDTITVAHPVIKASLNAYIPTQNVKDLYQQYKEKEKKIQWQ